MKLRIFLMVILIAVLAGICVQTHLNARCYVYGFDDAHVTVNGVFCHTHRPDLVKTYILLHDLDERAKKPVIDPRVHQKFHMGEF